MRLRGSLRLRLLAGGVLGVAIVSLAAALWLGRAFTEASERAFDRELARELESLIASAEVDDAGRFALHAEPVDPAFARPLSGHYWRIVAGDRQFQSRSLWDGELAVAVPERAGPAQALELAGPRGESLRARAQAVRFPRMDAPVLFVVASDRAGLTAEATGFRWRVAVAVAVLAGGLLGLVVLGVAVGLRPLARLSDTVARVRRGEDAQFPAAGLPTEVAPLAAHLNELLAHHDRSVQRARTAAQDLAHALKTPLSVLSLEAERPGPQLPAVVQAQVARMQASVERHLGRGIAADTRARTPVRPVAQALLALMQRVHGARGVAFALAPGEEVVFAGGREDLEEMLGNLLDNAGKWAASRVTVAAAVEAGRLQLEVRDDGPGLAGQALQEVIDRGVRLDERTPGSGLGLAIVRDIADGYGGRLSLSSANPGLRARLDLPAA